MGPLMHPDDVRRIAREGEALAKAVRDNFSWRLMGYPALEVGKDGIAHLVNFTAYVGREGFYNYVGMVPPTDGGQVPMRNLCVVPQGEYITSPSMRSRLKNILVHAAGVLGGSNDITYILSTDRPEDGGDVRFVSVVWEHPGDREAAPRFRSIADESKLGAHKSLIIKG